MGGQVYETLTDQLLKQGRTEGQRLEKLSMIDKLVTSGICSFEKPAK